MAKNNSKRRVRSLKIDPSAYSREVPKGTIEAAGLCNVPYGETVVVAGRIILADTTSKISKLGVFTTIDGLDVICAEQLGSNGVSVPVYVVKNDVNVEAMNSIIHYGDVVMVRGRKRKTDEGDVLLGDEISLLSKAMGDIYDPNIDFRNRLNVSQYRHLQLIQEQDRLIRFGQCSQILASIRKFLYQEGYNEVSMTMLQDSFEAGLADPFVTHSVAKGKDMYLRLSGELLMWRLMIAGFSKVFEFGKSFRNQGATLHKVPQFNLLELYRSYADEEEMETLACDMIRKVLVDLYGSAVIPRKDGGIDCSKEWEVRDFREEVKKLTGLEYGEHKPLEELVLLFDRAGIKRPDVVNRYTVALGMYAYVMSTITGPAFLRNLPAAQTPLYKLKDDGSIVDETLVIIGGMPIVTMVSPERDPVVVRERMETQLTYKVDQGGGVNEEVLDAMKYGLPPCRGMAIGVEHLFILLLGAENIRDVELFPIF